MRKSDTALSVAKNKGKKQYVFFKDDMFLSRTHQIELTQHMRSAIGNDEFKLFYQPIYNLKSDKVEAVEALIRWSHKTKGNIPPLDFIPLAELTGYIHDINDWVFLDAFKRYNLWKQSSLNRVSFSINVSAKSLTNKSFVSNLKNLCVESDVDCKLFSLEITETAMIEDLNQTQIALEELRKMGFNIALDDFGTGFSSLTYLKKLPINTIKIDRSFIKDCIEIDNDKKTLEYLIDLAHHLKMKVVAEGVETKEQLCLLKDLRCDFAQGYYLCKPLPVEDIEKFLKKTT